MSTSGFETFLNKLGNTDTIKVGVDKTIERSLTRMYNRAAQIEFTPVDTGELRNSRSRTKVENGGGEFGYNKEYAKYVEYGRRSKSGKFIQGQRYLFRNVQREGKILVQSIRDTLNSK